MEVLILTALLGGILLVKALRFNPFDHMVAKPKYDNPTGYIVKWINDNSGVNMQWLYDTPDGGQMSVINDGYGNVNAPYEIYFGGNDVDGYLTKNDVKHIMFNYKEHKDRLNKPREW